MLKMTPVAKAIRAIKPRLQSASVSDLVLPAGVFAAGVLVQSLPIAGVVPVAQADPNAHANAPVVEDPDALAFFEAQVRPILVNRCLECHGGEKVKGGLNFANRETTLAGGISGELVDWEHIDQSLLLAAISYEDLLFEMPPSGKMPDEEIETLNKWVAMGMPWTPGEAGQLAEVGEGEVHHEGPLTIEEGKAFWAYKPMKSVDVPEVSEAAWSENPIDAFIFDKLKENGLTPSPEADRKTLIRRVTYNLTGLPPTPREIQDFVNDQSPDAWEKVVDRLLASPQYGETWARHWMDVVRYAETDGYERDNPKLNIWRYRDYLIRAFNDDKPYDRMIKEQIAGDLLPDKDADSLIATGFQRLQIWDDEPTDRVQARADYIADVVDTTSAAFMGTTVGCARCHDHKKDPILQSDYYALYAFFNNITEPHRGNPAGITVDLRDMPREGNMTAELAKWDHEVESLQWRIEKAEEVFQKRARQVFEKTEHVAIAPDSRQELQAWRYTMQDPGNDWYLQAFNDRDWQEATGGFGHSLERPYFNNDWATDHIWMRRNFRLTEMPKFLVLSATHRDRLEVHINGIKVYEADGRTGPNHKPVQLPAEALSALVVGSNSLAVKCTTGRGEVQFVDVGLYQGIQDPRAALVAAMAVNGEQVLGKANMRAYEQNQAKLDRLLAAPPMEAYPASIISERNAGTPSQNIHRRGNANVPGDEVPARFPMVLGGAIPNIPSVDANSSGRRLVLAEWLASDDNALTARVMANRIWQYQFGRGIVRTSSDFGQLGELPTHEDLLNFLAEEFVKNDWSIKHMQRLILTSKAFRMSSQSRPEGMAADPANNLFWRYDMRRLTAEEFRDSVLLVNGSLNNKLFGPSIYTKMPDEVLATASRPDRAWGTSVPKEQDRRSVYIHIKRSLREPLLAALDQAETDTPCPVRFATTVPTQSLIMLNSDFMQEEALVFSQRLRKEGGGSLRGQVALGLRLVLGREATDEEIQENLVFITKMKNEHNIGDARALQIFCLVALNLNEFMYLD